MADTDPRLMQPYLGLETGIPPLRVPATVEDWLFHRDLTRRTLLELLGDLPPRPSPVQATVLGTEQRDGFRVERVSFDNGAGVPVPGYVLIPDGVTAGAPAVLFHHQHAGRYDAGKDEILRPDWPVPGVCAGAEFARKGHVVLAIDAYAFGERRWHGPSGQKEEGSPTEWSLSKMFLWQGATLWGMMVRDDQIALDYLCSRPEVDAGGIASLGMSMGSTRTWWLAALDDRIACAVCVVCLTHYQTLIEQGLLWAHGIYYFVPNVLRHFDTETIVSLIAPRALLTLSGELDQGSPIAGVRIINEACEAAYALHGRPERFRGVLYPGVDHAYTEEMWAETLAWLQRWV